MEQRYNEPHGYGHAVQLSGTVSPMEVDPGKGSSISLREQGNAPAEPGSSSSYNKDEGSTRSSRSHYDEKQTSRKRERSRDHYSESRKKDRYRNYFRAV